MTKTIFFLLLSGFLALQPLRGDAQATNTKSKKERSPDSLNQFDKDGKKTGLWYYHFKAQRGEPAYSYFGNYLEDAQNGLWYKMDDEGRLVSIEQFKDGEKDGTAQYYEDGMLAVVGNYKRLNKGLKPDSFWVTDPITLYDTLIVLSPNLGSVRHGVWRYYNPRTGQLVAEEQYQADYLLRRKEFQNISQSDSLYIQRRIQELPHNKHPKGDKDFARPPSSPLYPKFRKPK